jgi:hypothetical protein
MNSGFGVACRIWSIIFLPNLRLAINRGVKWPWIILNIIHIPEAENECENIYTSK